jgi:hypothetical protein
MSLRKSFAPVQAFELIAALSVAAIVLLAATARAGHELPYYPSFYPQEIRIEPIDPETAAKEFAKTAEPLNVYIGAAPRFAGEPPTHLKSLLSLQSFLVASVNPQSKRMQDRDTRCAATGTAASALAKRPDLVRHPYPVTPYHADYLGHADLAAAAKAAEGPGQDGSRSVTYRSADAGATPLLASQAPSHATEWDMRVDEIPVGELLQKAGAGIGAWMNPPWAKEGWFQAYHLLRESLAEGAARERADALYERLTQGEFKDSVERHTFERDLVAALTKGCERVVVGYRLRREFYNDDFSNGIENILVDSQSGFNSPVFVRTVKLKDFPWNGWLRIGIAPSAPAAWNPVAGFTDAPGRLVWSAVGDDAFLPVPHNSRSTPNRAEIKVDADAAPSRQSVRIPADAVVPQPKSGMLAPAGAGRGAMTRLTYRVSASSFHDGTEMEAADLFYPYALAFRWGERDGATYDEEVSAATQWLRQRLRAVRIVNVEERSLKLADLSFDYRSPIVEVYLDDASVDEEERALIAPPWSSVPWHVLALLEAAVERGIGAFSRTEAARRNVPWLELVRDAAQREKLTALVKEFAGAGYRPAALQDLVTPEAATARWQALAKFIETSNHLLVTNGPYRLTSAAPDAFVLAVVREFTYPIGIGLFDPFANPPRAIVTTVQHIGNRIFVSADVDVAVKQQRDRRIVRKPLKRDTMRETFPIRPLARYIIVDEHGKVAAAGNARWEADGRFAALLPATLPAGKYAFFAAVLADGNALDPSIGRIDFRNGGPGQ